MSAIGDADRDLLRFGLFPDQLLRRASFCRTCLHGFDEVLLDHVHVRIPPPGLFSLILEFRHNQLFHKSRSFAGKYRSRVVAFACRAVIGRMTLCRVSSANTCSISSGVTRWRPMWPVLAPSYAR